MKLVVAIFRPPLSRLDKLLRTAD